MAIKKGDFVSIDYVGKLASTGEIFDLTDVELAKKSHLFSPRQKYGEVVICVGENQLVHGLDLFLEEKEAGKDYKVDIEPEQGFGPRIAKLIQLVSLKKFKDHQTMPYPGARVMIDNIPAVVRSTSGGRVLVDFNHPLAGKKLRYDLKINKIVTDKQEQAKSLLEKFLPANAFSVELKEKYLAVKLTSKGNYEPLYEQLEKDMRRLIKDIDKITFE